VFQEKVATQLLGKWRSQGLKLGAQRLGQWGGQRGYTPDKEVV
jgi:hypothetical protein